MAACQTRPSWLKATCVVCALEKRRSTMSLSARDACSLSNLQAHFGTDTLTGNGLQLLGNQAPVYWLMMHPLVEWNSTVTHSNLLNSVEYLILSPAHKPVLQRLLMLASR